LPTPLPETSNIRVDSAAPTSLVSALASCSSRGTWRKCSASPELWVGAALANRVSEADGHQFRFVRAFHGLLPLELMHCRLYTLHTVSESCGAETSGARSMAAGLCTAPTRLPNSTHALPQQA